MATVGRLVVEVITDIAKFTEGMDSVAGRAKRVGDSLTKFGALATAGVTLPLAGIGAAAIRASTDLNAAIANVASLGVPAERVNELKTSVQDLAIEVGKSTGDMADGLYQVISAFGDTADTVSILEINARAAAAGLATTTDAINLTSAVTKGYGDVSAEAVGKVADLAFQAVKLGQTTFPELASSMGQVVPIAASMGARQEELFAVMATLTGVTGSASEVATQLRGALQALMAPTTATQEVMATLGYESGQAMVEQLGLVGAIKALVQASQESGQPLQQFMGSIEGQTLALALAGPQADAYREKLRAMERAAGSTDKAFEAQTEGINSAGFTMAQVRAKTEVLMQRLGDGLAPALLKVLERAEPLIDRAIDLANRFANADSETQTWIVTIGAAVAAIGPVVTAVGMFISGVSSLVGVVGSVIGILGGGGAVAGTLAGALTLLTGPVGLIVAAVAGLAVAWATNFMGIRDKTQAAVGWIIDKFNQLLSVDWGRIGSGIVSGIANGIRSGIGWIADAARQAAQRALDAAKSFLGIRSPSRLAAREIGGPFMMGFGIGALDVLDRTMRDVGKGLMSSVERMPVPEFAPAGAGTPINVSIRQEFYGNVDAETVQRASGMGIKEAMRRIGMR